MAKSKSLYRWVILAVFCLINLVIQTLWISFAPITTIAAKYYESSELRIGMLSMLFMITFIPLSLPVSWLIDRYGYKLIVGIGSIIMGVFGLTRGLAGSNISWVSASTFGIAVAQPFLLNAWTTVSAQWFPKNERATTLGIITFASLLGSILGLVLTPLLIDYGFDIAKVQLFYGGFAVLSALLFLVFTRNPPTPGLIKEGEETRALMLDGLKYALSIKSFLLYLIISFIGLSIFNGLTTWVEAIIKPKGFLPKDAGLIGALMLIGGVVGSLIFPVLSDKSGKRKLFIQIGLFLSIPALLIFTFSNSRIFLTLSSFSIGFFLISVGPIGLQYSAEVTSPTPTGTSNGLIQLFGQTSVVFVYIMEILRGKDGSFIISLIFSSGLLAIGFLLSFFLKEEISK